MAENIKVKIEVDATSIKTATADSKQLEAALLKAGVPVEFMNDALDEVDKTLKEASVDAGKFAKALDSSATSTKSLRTQLAEAKNEAVKMSQQFGAFSKEAQTAAKRAAVIKDEIDDLNDTLNALNPEAKLNAFVKLGQGIQGGFQAATGTLQLFGVENERITKLAQQFQGVLNLTQGINSVLQLKDVYGQLRLVLGLTTTAQTGLNTTMAAGALAAAPYIVAIGAILAATYLLTESFDDEAEAMKKVADERERLTNATIAASSSYLDFIGVNEKIYTLLREQGATELQILQLKDKNLGKDLELLRAAQARLNEADFTKENLEKQNEITNRITDALLDRQIIQAQINKLLKEQAVLADQAKNNFDKAKLLPSPAQVKQDTEEALDVIATTIKGKSTDIPPLPFWSKEEIRERMSFAISIAQETLGVISAFTNAQNEEEIASLEELNRRKAISEEEYQRRLRKLRREQAEENKKIQLFSATMAAAQGIINALGTTPASAVPFAVALASVVGAANIAKIAAAPIPKFKAGTLNVGGGNIDSDGGMHAIIHRGEAVIPADRNREYHPTIAALYNRKIKASDINSYVEMKLKGKIPERIDAKINSRELSRLIPKNDRVAITNTGALAKQIGREIANNQDLRMR